MAQPTNGGTPSLKDLGFAVLDIVKLMSRVVVDPGVPKGVRAGLVLAGVYIVSPIDVVPDFIPKIGHLDDLAVLVLALDLLVNYVPEDVLKRHWDGDEEMLVQIGKLTAKAATLVPNSVRSKLQGWISRPEATSRE